MRILVLTSAGVGLSSFALDQPVILQDVRQFRVRCLLGLYSEMDEVLQGGAVAISGEERGGAP